MSENTSVVEVAVEAADVDAPKVAVKRRDLAKIGRNLARQITKGSFDTFTVDAVMERKAADRVQAKSIIAHAAKVLAERGKDVPEFV